MYNVYLRINNCLSCFFCIANSSKHSGVYVFGQEPHTAKEWRKAFELLAYTGFVAVEPKKFNTMFCLDGIICILVALLCKITCALCEMLSGFFLFVAQCAFVVFYMW